MDLARLSNEELTLNLHGLQRDETDFPPPPAAMETPDVQRELELQRVELEMQGRALREMQVALEEAVQRYSDLYDHLPVANLTLTRNGRIIRANLTAASWLQADRAQLAGTYLQWYLDAFDAGRLAAHLESCVADVDPLPIELTLRLGNGLQITVQLSSRLAPPDDEGRPIHTAITNIKQLRHAHLVLSDIQREQAAFAPSISNELRAPLVTINEFTRILLDHHGECLNPDARSMVERIEGAVARMESHLHSLLEFCHLGPEAMALDPVNLEELMQQVMLEHRLLLAKTGAEVEVERPLPCVRGSRLILGQVLATVLVGAVRSAAQTPRIGISSERRGPMTLLRIADQSHAVEPDRREHSYRLFERLHNPVAGVGFPIIRDAIERMNGRVSLEADAGTGSCVIFELPHV